MKASRSFWKKLAARVLWLAVTLTLVTFLAPPASAPQAANGGTEVVLGASDEGREVELLPGQTLALKLDANPATGYGWYVQDLDTNILTAVGQPEIQSPDLLGAPGTAILRFRPQRAGRTPLVLAYRRPWEDAAPLRTFAVQVQAAGDLTAGGEVEAPVPAAAPAVDMGTATTALPAALNWCTAVGCTPPRDQGPCGSCWAFATVGALEQSIRIVDGASKDLSEQYLLSCNGDGMGCNGGWWAHDYHQWRVPSGEPGPGAVYEAAFPYTASKVACNPPHTHYEKIASWAYVGPVNGVPSVSAIQQAIYDHGPIAAAICVSSAFGDYEGGVFATNESCGTSEVNHGVVLVGWDNSLGANGAWILRNSWGSGWGEGGYMKIAYGTSKVGFGASYVNYGPMPHTPTPPTNLQADSVSQSRIDVTWTDTSSNESGFYVERSPNGSSNWQQVVTVAANVQKWSNTGLHTFTQYYYRLRAYNSSGTSAYSSVLSAWTHPVFSQFSYLPLVTRRH